MFLYSNWQLGNEEVESQFANTEDYWIIYSNSEKLSDSLLIVSPLISELGDRNPEPQTFT